MNVIFDNKKTKDISVKELSCTKFFENEMSYSLS